MATLMQQQPTMKDLSLETIPQHRFPLVHVLTSKSESDEAKVRYFFAMKHVNYHYL